MTPSALCAACGARPVGYVGRECCYTCVPRRGPRLCARCGLNPVGYGGRECCFGCAPRRPRLGPLVCKRCGSTDIYTSELCRRCHRLAPLVESCRDCLAWGVTRHNKWYCQACRHWQARYLEQDCPGCGRHVVVNHRGYCRLCCRQATARNNLDPAHRVLDMQALTRDGQQLFFADLILKKRGKQPGATPPAALHRPVRWPDGYPVAHQQLVLFAWPRDLTSPSLRGIQPPIPALGAALLQAVAHFGDGHGWTQRQQDMTWRGIRVLLAIADTPGARINASDADLLLDVPNTTRWPVLQVLDSVRMLHDDRQPPLQGWFDNHIARIPTPMRAELRAWFLALRDGSTTPPRMRPRHIGGVRCHVGRVLPIAKQWAADGHESLREITRDDVTHALRTAPNRTYTLGSLRSLFRYLKATRQVFLNPTARMRGDPRPPFQLQPVELDAIRDAINSNDPARAAISALIAFHALRNGQIRKLLLTDIRDRRVHVDGNPIPLAEPVHQRLNTWLTHRAQRWPNTANPHLFISVRTAGRTTPIDASWVIHQSRRPPRRHPPGPHPQRSPRQRRRHPPPQRPVRHLRHHRPAPRRHPQTRRTRLHPGRPRHHLNPDRAHRFPNPRTHHAPTAPQPSSSQKTDLQKS